MTSVRAPDTSVVVAGLSSWHTHHGVALPALAGSPPAIQHVMAESYSVLTRLPQGRGVAPSTALRAIQSVFGTTRLSLTARQLEKLLVRLADAGVSGGSVYDAIVAESARLRDVELVSLDRRAGRIYDLVGAGYTLLG